MLPVTPKDSIYNNIVHINYSNSSSSSSSSSSGSSNNSSNSNSNSSNNDRILAARAYEGCRNTRLQESQAHNSVS